MVSSVGFLLGKNSRVTGFGVRRPATRGRGFIRKAVGAVSRPALTYIANKIADVISGSGRKRRTTVRKTVRGSSWKLTGQGRRKPRSTLTRKRRTTTTRRAPRRTLGGVRKRRVCRR